MTTATVDARQRLSIFERMLLMRHFEEAVVRLFKEGHFASHYHLYIGQEATGAAALEAMAEDDLVGTTHRGHGHVVGRGADPGRALAEILGLATGFSGGRGGTLHLCDRSHNFLSTSAVVGSCAGLAAGAAYGIKVLGESRVAVAFFGDGSLEEGLLSETFNIAGLWQLPLILVCENNSGGAIGQAAGGYPTSVNSAQSLSRIPASYGLATAVVDGADATAVYTAMRTAIGRARSGGGTTFIEAMTERWPGNQGLWPELATVTDLRAAWDPARAAGPHADWLQQHDPVLRLARELVADATSSQQALLALDEKVRGRIAAAAEFAIASPAPTADSAGHGVFAS